MNAPPRVERERLAAGGMVCSVDHLASAAGARLLAQGASAADAAIAASAVLTVTTQHMCGMGGDLWAVVHDGQGPPVALNASGRAGSGADPGALRADGHTIMPFRGDIRSVPVPGCVDGWLDLHQRFGRASIGDVLGPAIELAERGFATTHSLAAAIPGVVEVDGADDYLRSATTAKTGELIVRPGVARSLRAIVDEGRKAWYEGEFGEGLIRLGNGLYTREDLQAAQSEWPEPTRVEAWGHQIWTTPPNSQGYLSLASAVIADGLALPDDPNDPLWAHLLVEASKQAAFDRADSLFDGADGSLLVAEERLGPRRAAIDHDRASQLQAPGLGGGTIYLCAVDESRMGVSLIQSNAAGFGAHLTVPEVGVFLHNRGIGFSLAPGHPAELAPGKRPPSTLSPALVTTESGSLRSVLGTMGGDGQPQVVLQMLARQLQAGSSSGTAVTAPRFTLTVPDTLGFDTWAKSDRLLVAVEEGSSWEAGLSQRGHEVRSMKWGNGLFGHAHLIELVDDHLAGVAEPRTGTSATVGI